jgi:hypothetical protein
MKFPKKTRVSKTSKTRELSIFAVWWNQHKYSLFLIQTTLSAYTGVRRLLEILNIHNEFKKKMFESSIESYLRAYSLPNGQNEAKKTTKNISCLGILNH